LQLQNNSGNVVQGNYIGTDVTGTADLGNEIGLGLSITTDNVVGGAESGAGNLISGNFVGLIVSADTTRNVIQGNLVGTDATGTLDLGNERVGILIQAGADGNLVGGTETGAGNIVAYNDGPGIWLIDFQGNTAGSGNSVLGNSIFANDGLGIDLGLEGLTPNDLNDTDTGPNDLLNFPVLASAVLAGGDLLVTGSINTEQGKTLRIEFFASPTADPSGHGEGQTYLGFVTVEMGTENTVNFSQTLAGSGVLPGQVITATTTDELGNTSEFSLALAVS
jgi:titin